MLPQIQVIAFISTFTVITATYNSTAYNYLANFDMAKSRKGTLLNEIDTIVKSEKICTKDLDCTRGRCFGSCINKTCQFSTKQCKRCGKIRIKIDIKTDFNPEQSTWTLTGLSRDYMIGGGPYTESYKLYEESFCIVDSSYSFMMLDSDGDGLRENAYYKLYVNKNIIKESYGWTPFNFKTSIICSNDADCDSGDACIKDSCDKKTKQCSSEIIETDNCGSFGNRTVLALRINALDSSTTSSVDELSNHIFGTFGADFSMHSQFSGCSYNKFNVNPFNGITNTGIKIDHGVSEIDIDLKVLGEQAGTITNVIVEAANEKFGDLQNQFDFVMICLPPDTLVASSENWRAYSFVDSYLSIYNDLNCIYPSVQMHEIGHNLGLPHSNDEERYGDETCIMGLSYSRTDGPRKCFNGAKSWQLGWYHDTNYEFDGRSVVFGVRYGISIVGLSHYHRPSTVTIIKATNSHNGFDYYVTFNHISDLNAGAAEGANEILITRRLTGSFYSDSYLISRLSDSRFHVALDFYYNTNLYLTPSIFLTADPPHAMLFVDNFFLNCEQDQDCDDNDPCSIDTCTDFGNGVRQCIFSAATCAECGVNIQAEVYTNSQPRALFWSIENLETGLLRSSGYYLQPNTLHKRSGCLAYGKYRYLISYAGNSTADDSIRYSIVASDEVFESGEIYEQVYTETIMIICSSDLDCNDFDGCTLDTCDPESKLCTNTLLEDNDCSDCSWFSFNFTADNFIDETTWDLTAYQTKELVISGNPYPLYVRGHLNRETPLNGRSKAPTRVSGIDVRRRELSKTNEDIEAQLFYDSILVETCLANHYLYHFIIRDSFGDGICCSEGQGSYSVSVSGVEVFSGADFTTYEEYYFKLISCSSQTDCEDSNAICTTSVCLSDISTCAYFVQSCDDCGAMIAIDFVPDESPQQSMYKITDLEDLELLAAGPYTTSYETYSVSQCFPYGTYMFKIMDTFGDGMIACYHDNTCGYSMKVNEDITVVGGVEFGEEDLIYMGICLDDSHCDDRNSCTKNACDTAKKICTFEKLSCQECGLNLFTLSINFDLHPSQNEWELLSGDTNVTVLSGGPYLDSRRLSSLYINECIADDEYFFIFYDSGGDGLTSCGESNDCGAYNLIINDEILMKSDGHFQKEQVGSFSTSSISRKTKKPKKKKRKKSNKAKKM